MAGLSKAFSSLEKKTRLIGSHAGGAARACVYFSELQICHKAAALWVFVWTSPASRVLPPSLMDPPRLSLLHNGFLTRVTFKKH